MGWWRNEFYRKERDSLEFRTYWDGQPTKEEREWMREIYEEYHVNVTPEQLAWWRWYLAENVPGSEINLMFQQFPPTAEYAFQMSGSKFFSVERVNIAYKRALEEKPSGFFRYKFGLAFEQTEFLECGEHAADVTIWEMPAEGGMYVLGADPAYGSSEWADRFVLSVWRCFADKIVQVAEACTDEWTEAHFAWALSHLAGSYRPCMVNLEMQGPGGAVFNELQNLKKYAGSPTNMHRDIYNVLGGIRDYLWRKQDSIMGSLAYQWQTTQKEKIRMLSTFRNYFEREMLVIRSPELAVEMRNISRAGDQIGGEGRAKDDRVIGAGLAIIAWNDWIMQEMMMSNRTYALETRPKGEAKMAPAGERAVLKYLQSQGIRGFGGDAPR